MQSFAIGRIAAIVLSATLVTLVGTLNRGCAAEWSYDEHVGVVSARGQTICFATNARALAANVPLLVVDPNTRQQRRAVIVAPDDNCVDAAGRGAGLRPYAIRFDGAAPTTPFHAIGVVGATIDLKDTEGAMVADVDGDGRDEFFRFCTSAEGVHFTIWSDAALTGQRRWHRYHYLGYDVSPTCTPAETAEDRPGRSR